MPGAIDKHEFTRYSSEWKVIAHRLRKRGFGYKDHNYSLREAIKAYNKSILAQFDAESLGKIQYLPDGRIRRSLLQCKKGSQPYYRRLRQKQAEERFHARFYILSKGRYKNPNQEYHHSLICPETGRKVRGSPLASSQTLMREALARYGQQELDGADPLAILLQQLFQEALQGDKFARSEILCRVLPVPRDSTIKLVEQFDAETMDAATLMRALIGELVTGRISPSDSKTALSSFETLFRTESFEQLVKRIDDIERSRVVSHQSVEDSRQSALDSGLLIDEQT